MEILILLVGHWFLSLFCQSFFLHRYGSHHMFKMSFAWERFFYFLTYLLQGPSFLNPRCYAILHQRHHAFSDTENDPHSPNHAQGIWQMMLETYKQYSALLNSSGNKSSETARAQSGAPSWPALDNFAKSYSSIILWAIIYTVIYLSINPEPYLYLLLPIHFFIGPIQGAIVNWFGHKVGYRNYEIKDQSKNSLPIDFALMGELYQNNHHQNGKNMNFARKWFEIDFTYQISKLLSFFGVISLNNSIIPKLNKAKLFIFILLVSFSVSAQEKKLIGKALLEYSFLKIDVYEISYYKGKNDYEEIVLDYKINVKRKHSQEGWKVGLKPTLEKNGITEEQVSWVYQNTVDLKKGDKLSLIKQKNKVTLLKNNETIASIEDKVIAKLIHYPWIGETPIDEKLKKSLLGL
ncbi:MAG: fatty acid desaturase [Bacteriovoracaceae bacterium]|nr:fatty acid desaturase [Bacteriovoracaceae bacterium]